MKKAFLSCLFTISFLTMSFGQSSLVATPDWGVRIQVTPNQYIITYRPSEFRIVNDSLNDYVDMNQNGPFCYLDFVQDIYDLLEDPGRPELPFYSLSLQVPDTSSIASIVNITRYVSNKNHIILPYNYIPSQDRVESSTDNTLYFDSAYYASNGTSFPIAELSPTYSFVRTAGVELTINPFEYSPHHNEIIVPDSIRIVVSVESNSNLVSMVNQYVGQDCPQDAIMYYDTYAGLNLVDFDECLGDYIILTEKQYRDELVEFVQHKSNWGYNVFIYDVETENLDDATDIRTFLFHLYHNSSNPRFLLLVGSLDKIPASAGVMDNMNNPPTDIYYACLEKLSITDETNLYPEIYVGRWLVNNTRELNNVMQKSMDNENVFRYTTLCHAELFSGTGNGKKMFKNNVKTISSKVLSPMNYPNAYHLGTDTNVDSSTMKQIIHNDTTWLFYYRGHGGSDRIGSPYNLPVSGFYKQSYAYLGLGFACSMGDVYCDCFAKNWLCNENRGGPIYFASTTSSNRCCNNNHSKRIFRMLKNNRNMHIAQMTVGGSNKYYGSLRTSSERKKQIKKYMLYGDPSLFIWGAESSVPYRLPQQTNHSSTDGDAVEYVFDINGRLLGIGNSIEILQNIPHGVYIIYNSTENTHVKILK